MIERIDFYAGMVISGLCGGMGSALGAYLVNRGIIRHIDKLESKIKKSNSSGQRKLFNDKTK